MVVLCSGSGLPVVCRDFEFSEGGEYVINKFLKLRNT